MDSKNKMFCIVTKSGFDYLEDEFFSYMSKFLKPNDSGYIAGGDVSGETIYFTCIDEYKVSKMIKFFKTNDIFIKCEEVSNIVEFLNSDKKYLEIYNDERNKIILNNFIVKNVSIDNILDRMIGRFMLLSIELDILNKKEYAIVYL